MKTDFINDMRKIAQNNKIATKQSNGLSLANLDFNKLLKQGEYLEDCIIEYINQLDGYKALKLPYKSEIYNQYNHVDILVYKDGQPFICIDAKINTTPFYKASFLKNRYGKTGLTTENATPVNLDSLGWYKQNNLPTYLVTYKNNGFGKSGFYACNVKDLTDDKLYICETSSYKLKANYSLQNCIYNESLEILKMIL